MEKGFAIELVRVMGPNLRSEFLFDRDIPLQIKLRVERLRLAELARSARENQNKGAADTQKVEKAERRPQMSPEGVRLPGQVTLIEKKNVRFALSPMWVEWLMGYPEGRQT